MPERSGPELPVRYALVVTRLPSVRASDADREEVAERLRDATAEGRLTADELDERLEALYAARTYGELDALVADLPARSSPGGGSIGMPRWVSAAGLITVLVTVLGLLAGAARHSAEAVRGARYGGRFGFPGPPGEPHHAVVAAASVVTVLAVFVVFATLLWLVMRSRHASDA
jgi:Domain of unknown function (DUF1707)